MAKKITTEEFIKRAMEAHGDKYDYSLVEYINGRKNVTIICSLHGEFQQRSSNHYRCGCPMCSYKKSAEGQKISTGEFIKRAIEAHGDKYDYSLVDYINNRTNVTIICSLHGEFQQMPSNHYRFGCPMCSYKKSAERQRLTTEEFTKRAKEVHGDKYDYSLVEYIDNRINVTIICSLHGEFQQMPNSHYRCGCPMCGIIKRINTVSKKRAKKFASQTLVNLTNLINFKNTVCYKKQKE